MKRDEHVPLQEKLHDRQRSNYYDNQNTTDPFLDPFLIHPENDKEENDKHCKEIDEILSRAKAEDFREEHQAEPKEIVRKHASAFQATFYSSLEKVGPVRIDLKRYSQAVRIRLRNYFTEQNEFLATFVF